MKPDDQAGNDSRGDQLSGDQLVDSRIRAALDLAAEHSPQPDRILAALAQDRRYAGQRRLLLVAGTTVGVAAATTAVGVPLLRADRRPAVPDPAASPATPSPSTAPTPANRRFPIPYRLGWVPDGFVEIERNIENLATGRWSRSWRLATDPEDLVDAASIQFGLRPRSTMRCSATPVTVHGVSGWLELGVKPQAWSMLSWPLPGSPETVLYISALTPQLRTRELLQHMADSAADDPDAVIEAPLQLGWTPFAVSPQRIQFGRSGSAWSSRMYYLGVDGSSGLNLQAGTRETMNPHQIHPADRPSPWEVRAGTGQGWLYDPTSNRPYPAGWVTFDVTETLAATVSVYSATYPLTKADILRVAEELAIGATPDVSWIGR